MTTTTPQTPPAPPKLGSHPATDYPLPFGITSGKSHKDCEFDEEDFYKIRGFRRAEKISRPRLKIKEEQLCA